MKYIIVNRLLTWLAAFATIVAVSSCDKEIDQVEVYKKTIYLVHSEDLIHSFIHPFQEEPSEGFITIYCSGSALPDKDIQVEIEFDDEIVDKYNFIEFENDSSRYVQVLDQEKFDIPSLTVSIKKGEIYSNMPILLDSKGLSPDTTYVIPLRIKQVSDYEINEELNYILYAIELENDYSGKYRMAGTITDTVSGKEQQVFKEKTIVPIDEVTSRMFLAAENESAGNIATRTLTFRVNPDNSVVINEENDVIDLGGGQYLPEKGIFTLHYSFLIGEQRFEMFEKLINLDEKKQ